jgi:hypothetical protein
MRKASPARSSKVTAWLLCYSISGFSLYTDGADYAARRANAINAPPDLARVDLRIVPIDRPDHAARQAAAMQEFWPAYFDAAEARSVSIDPAP